MSYPEDPKKKEHVPFNALRRDEDLYSKNESVMMMMRIVRKVFCLNGGL